VTAVPLVEIRTCEILDRRKLLSRKAELVTVPIRRSHNRPGYPEHASFPIMLERRFVSSWLDPAEPLSATDVVDPVHMLGSARRGLKVALRADHAVAGDDCRKTVFSPASGALGTLRQDQVSKFGGTIPDADGDMIWQFDAELGQDGAGLANWTRPVGLLLVPGWLYAEHGVGIARAQGADDEVVDPLGVLDRLEMSDGPSLNAQLLDGGSAISEQPRL